MQSVETLLDLRLLYGRVDIVRDGEGQALIMEVEISEPMLSLARNSDALAMLTQGIIEAMLSASAAMK
jgi:hypothetical protein